ncbi:MAG: Cache 3/Cache 2 fusion domain-containing protein [Clostridiales bacterium]|nr:Cache 3/Cache 2 fusion domain-containing protein [Clostridiales bacterium]
MNVKKTKLQKKSKRLATTLVLFSVSILLILNFVSAVCIGALTRSGMDQKQDAFLQQTTLSGKRQAEQFIEQYIGITETLAQSTQLQRAVKDTTQDRPASDTPEFSEALVLLQRTMGEYPDILGVGFGSLTEDYIYNQDGTRLNVLLSERPYFQNAKEGTYVTQPYVDSATDEMCVSVATPLSDGSTVIGLLVLDLKLTQVSDFLKEMDFGESGRIVLLSENNTILGHEDHDMIGKNFADLDIQGALLEQIEAPTNEIVNYKLDGESRVGTVQELSGGGWKVLSSMSQAEYNAQTTKTTVSLVLLLLGSTAVVAILLWIIITKRLRPVSQLNEALREMSMGNLHIAVTHNGRDEVGEMAESLRECIRNLSSYINEIDRVMDGLAQGDLTIQTDVAFQGDFMPI